MPLCTKSSAVMTHSFGWIVAQLLVVLLLLSACSSPDPVPSATWVLRDSADVVDIDVPEGWVRLDPAKGETAANLKIVSPSREHRESISVMYHSHESLSFVYGYSGPFFGPDTLEDDLHAYRDGMREDWVNRDGDMDSRFFTDTSLLPDREIDGYLAAGFSGQYHLDGAVYPTDVWCVWREDGVWEVYVLGFPDEDDIPQELLDAVGTIRWTIPSVETPVPTPTPSE